MPVEHPVMRTTWGSLGMAQLDPMAAAGGSARPPDPVAGALRFSRRLAGKPATMTSTTETTASRETARPPESPTDMGRGSWLGVVKRTVREFRHDNVTDWAAALTYYAVLAIFPAIIALVSILGLLGMLAVSAVAVVLTGGLAKQVGNLVGLGSTAVQVWDIAKWPVLLIVVSLMFALLYWSAPNVKQAGFRWVSPGGLFGVLIWV